MSTQSSKLMWHFFLLYCGVTIFGMLTVTVDNLFVNGLTLKSLTEYNLKAISIQALSMVAIFQLFTSFRLRQPLVWIRLTRFPIEMFWTMLIFGLLASPLYHLVGTLLTEPSKRDKPWEIAVAILYEQILCLILAILLFTLIRRLLRPYILNLPDEELRVFSQSTFIKPLTLSFTSLLLIGVLRPLEYVLFNLTTNKPLDPLALLLIASSTIIFGLILYLLIICQFRDEVRVLIRGMLSLLEGDRSWLKRRMPIISTDEVGQLGIAFNTLQEQISRNYQEVQQEFQLAYQVQQKLLAPALHRIGEYQIAATCQPAKEVGGDLYDVLTLDESRFAIITGDVSGRGMPAALVMSAVLALFRTEVRRGGSADEVLTRLNRAVVETLQGNMFITLGVGILNQRSNTLEYASAGHMDPYILRDQEVIPIPCSSLPLGINKEEMYSEVVIPLKSSDRVIFYTDGVVEAMNEEGEIFGFQALEYSLSHLDPQAALLDQVHTLLRNLPKGSGAYEDDRTILLLEYLQGEGSVERRGKPHEHLPGPTDC